MNTEIKKIITIEIEGEDKINLGLAILFMKKAFDDLYCSPSMKFRIKEDKMSKKNELEKRVTKLEGENVFFSNEQYGDITQNQIIHEILCKLGLRIETNHIPAKEEIKEFKLEGKEY